MNTEQTNKPKHVCFYDDDDNEVSHVWDVETNLSDPSTSWLSISCKNCIQSLIDARIDSGLIRTDTRQLMNEALNILTLKIFTERGKTGMLTNVHKFSISEEFDEKIVSYYKKLNLLDE